MEKGGGRGAVLRVQSGRGVELDDIFCDVMG